MGSTVQVARSIGTSPGGGNEFISSVLLAVAGLFLYLPTCCSGVIGSGRRDSSELSSGEQLLVGSCKFPFPLIP